jgi:hypothetical protein
MGRLTPRRRKWLTGGCRTVEARNRSRLLVKHLEDGREPRGCKEIRDASREMQKFELAAALAEREMGPDDRAHAEAIHVGYVGKIEEDLLHTLSREAAEGLGDQRVAIARAELPMKIEHEHVTSPSFLNLHVRLLTTSGA